MPKNVGIIRFSGPWIQVIQNEIEARIKYRRTEPVFTGSVLASNIASFLHTFPCILKEVKNNSLFPVHFLTKKQSNYTKTFCRFKCHFISTAETVGTQKELPQKRQLFFRSVGRIYVNYSMMIYAIPNS